MKKVLLIIIDALATRIVEPALASGRLPNLAKLIEVGNLDRECIAVFPSITPAATCSLATGCYPHEHGILGAHWYDEQNDDVAYFGTDVWPIINEGLEHYLVDFQSELNTKRLLVPTIFEQVEQHGQLTDAVINLLWFRGTIEHEIQWPTLLKLAPGTTHSSLYGPHLMFMGDFVNSPLGRGEKIHARGGLMRRFGFHDEATADYLLELAEKRSLPDLTIAYFPNNDFESHKIGPEQAITEIQAVDKVLEQLFALHGGLNSLLKDYAILITGDHSQSDLSSASDAAVDLDECLAEFQVVPAGSVWKTGDDVMVCPNMRAAQIYLNHDSWPQRSRVIENLLDADGIDQVIWCDCEEGLAGNHDAKFHVATADRGTLTFGTANGDSIMGTDEFGGKWKWSGALSAVDAMVDGKRIDFKDYPNALERIATSFHRQSGSLWATARVGREFRLPETSCSERGSHGSLHALDSISPLITAGLPSSIKIPKPIRSVDITPICLQIMSLNSQRAPGASHVTQIPSKT